jgi:hypothetical protein
MTGADGLAALLGGHSPGESLHIVYGVLAIATLPVAASLSARAGARRSALTMLVGAVVLLVLIARLFQTG